MSRLGRRAGFTLVELMIASMIFSMVIAGLAAIYTTALSQTGFVVMNTKVLAMGNVAWRALAREFPSATFIYAPPKDGRGQFLEGCNHIAPDLVNFQAFIPDAPAPETFPRTFAFCVQTGVTPNCPAAPAVIAPIPANPQGCLFYYQWSAACFDPGVTAANCGLSISGVEPVMLASLLETNPAVPGGAFFSRAPADLGLPNGVRVGFQVRRSPKKLGQVPAVYAVDELLSAQFNPGMP